MGKIILVIVDGLGDLPVPSKGFRTPLQIAKTPNLDTICMRGLTGVMDPVEAGLACGSDTAHLSIFGIYRGRGAFEALGSGIDMNPGEIAFKCVFSCWDETTGIVTARKPEINFVSEARSFCEQLENFNLIPSFPEHKVHIYYVKEHRCVIKITGPQLSDEITGTDPTKDNCPLLRCQPTDDSKDARMTCAIVNELHDNVLKILSAHPINARRSLEAKPPVNVVLLRGCSVAIDVPSFESKHGLRTFLIAPTSIIAGIGRTLQMDLLKAAGATGTISTDMLSKAKVAMNTLFDPTNAYDMAIIHIKCTDDCGHSKDLYGKIDALERVDQMLGWILTYSPVKDGPHLVIITGDHSTPVLLGDHSTEPVPFVIARTDGSKLPGASSQCNFDEISCAQGVLGRFLGGSVMKIIRTVQDLPQIT